MAPGDGLHSSRGGALRNTNFRPWFFDPAAEKVVLPGLTPHELRYTAASLAVPAGVLDFDNEKRSSPKGTCNGRVHGHGTTPRLSLCQRRITDL
jgi:hypothetical protein